ncbi:MAG: restriction endonuclease subunit S [Acidobacteria bacterium]|nr:restriction endonuclease subunit S [Acidobacteriota bacterium]
MITRPGTRPFSKVRNGFTAFQNGDVIFAKITPCMENGKAAVARNLMNGFGFGSTEFHVIRSNAAVLPEYVYHFIRRESFRKAAEAEMTGSVGQKRVPADFMRKVEFPVAPLAEQHRIVAKVEELFTQVNSARARLVKVAQILNRFRQAVLATACSGRLTEDWRARQKSLEPASLLINRIPEKRQKRYAGEWKETRIEGGQQSKGPSNLKPRKVASVGLPEIPDEWTWIYLPDIGLMGRGKSRHRPRNAPHLFGGPYPFIQTGDIAQSRGRITSHRQTYSEAGLAQSRIWPTGTVCITIAANIANSAILMYPACFPDSVVGVNPEDGLCRPEYLEFFIRTARADLDQFAPATAQKNINIEILNDVAIALPPFEEQNEIVRRVEALFKLADAIEKRVEAATKRADKLTQAILAKAFRGELVPTEAELARRDGRDYEPASTVLKRIRLSQGATHFSGPAVQNSRTRKDDRRMYMKHPSVKN